MPIDTSIYGQIQPQQAPNQLANLAQAYQIRGMQTAMDKADRDAQQQNRLLSLVGDPSFAGLSTAEKSNKLQGIGAFSQAGDLVRADAAAAKDNREAEKSQLEGVLKKFEVSAQIMSGVTDQASWDRARALTAQTFGPEAAAKMPPQYNPALIQENLSKAMTVKDQVEQRYKALTQAETQRHNLATEATQAGTLKNAQDRLAYDQSQPKGQVVEGPNGPVLVDQRTGQSRPVTDSAGAPVGPKASEAQKKELMSIQQQRSIINGALNDVEKNPDAFGFWRGMAGKTQVGESLAGKMESDNTTQARSYLFNNVSRIINERAGAAQSAQELARLNGFLPADTDNAKQVANKLKAFSQYLDDLEAGTKGTPVQPNSPTQPSQGEKAPATRKVIGGKTYENDGKGWYLVN